MKTFFFRAPQWLPCIALAALMGSGPAWTQSEASTELSLLPLASVVATASAGAAVSGAAAALPAALSVAGAKLSVKSVEVLAGSTVVGLTSLADGAQTSIAFARGGVLASALIVGAVVDCTVTTTGTVLSVAGEVLAFVPNASGRALLNHERL